MKNKTKIIFAAVFTAFLILVAYAAVMIWPISFLVMVIGAVVGVLGIKSNSAEQFALGIVLFIVGLALIVAGILGYLAFFS